MYEVRTSAQGTWNHITPLHLISSSFVPPTRDAALLIGPEGGLTNEEVAIAIEHGFSLLQLGPRILRTEAAPVVALTALSIRWGEILN